MDLPTVIINYIVSDSTRSGGGGVDSGPGSALPLSLSSVDLAERSCRKIRGDEHRAREIPPPKEEVPHTGLVVVSQTQPTRHFLPPPLPQLILLLNARVQLSEPLPPAQIACPPVAAQKCWELQKPFHVCRGIMAGGW